VQEIGAQDQVVQPWADARRWLLAVPVALLPFLLALVALVIVKAIMRALGAPMFTGAYFVAAGASAFLSVAWSTAVVPHRARDLGLSLAVTYVLISASALFVLMVLDQHPATALHENETPELIQMLAVGGLGSGALGGCAWAWWPRRAQP
jgi:hypothetical protein